MDKSNISLERLRSFVRVVERGGLSAVARELGIGQSTVTRHLRELEEALGVPLLSRTTRRVTVTEEGRRYYTRCVQILRLLDQAAAEARSARRAEAGTIRLSCSAAFGVRQASRLVFAFQDRYPDIDVDFNLTDERIDLVREGVDLALRLGPLNVSNLKLRPLGRSQRLLVASPEYLALHGTPTSIEALSRHQGVRMTNVAGSDTLTLQGPDGRQHAVPFGGRLRVDHGLAAREAFAAGRGLGPVHHWLVDDLLASGRLVRILPDYTLPPVPINLLIVPERAGIARVRLLIDFLVEKIKDIPGMEQA